MVLPNRRLLPSALWRRAPLMLIGLLAAVAAVAQAPAPSLAHVLRDSLPPHRDTWSWDLIEGAGFVAMRASDTASGRPLLYLQAIPHDALTPELRARFHGRSNGFPAQRVVDRWLWVLVGRIELRLSPRHLSLESDSALEALVGEFNLQQLRDW